MLACAGVARTVPGMTMRLASATRFRDDRPAWGRIIAVLIASVVLETLDSATTTWAMSHLDVVELNPFIGRLMDGYSPLAVNVAAGIFGVLCMVVCTGFAWGWGRHLRVTWMFKGTIVLYLVMKVLVVGNNLMTLWSMRGR